MATKAAMEEIWDLLSPTLRNTHFKLKMHILTLLKMVNAKKDKELLELRATLMLNPTTMLNSELPLLNNPSQLPLKLIKVLSKAMLVVSSTALTVELTSTMESSLSASETMDPKITGLSRTHGVPAGVKMVTSELLMLLAQESAVSTWNPSTLMSDHVDEASRQKYS